MNYGSFTKAHTYARQYQVRGKRTNSSASDCHVAPETEQSSQFVPSTIDYHIDAYDS